MRNTHRIRVRHRARASTIAALLTAAMVLVPAVAGPASARSAPGRTGLDTARITRIARTIGRGEQLNATRAAVAARQQTRPHVTPVRRHADLGAKRATGPVRAGATSTLPRGTSGFSSPKIVAQPAPVVATSFPGIRESDVCACEPPDPWIAVSPSYVVQTTNGMVRVSNRTGATLLAEPTSALFNVPSNRLDSDPRIIWDAVHGRWVGVILTFNDTFDSNGLRLAVSETADPTAAWTVFPIEYGTALPDYPGISSSASRIVLTSDDFVGAAFVGPTWLAIDWSNILAGTSVFIGGVSYETSAFGHFRPAIALSTETNTPVIFEDGPSPGYFEISGPAASAATVNEGDLDSAFAIEPFTLPPSPVQPGALSIANATDERPTDAVYRNGALWFVATADSFDGTNHWAAARYTVVSTTANGAAPTAAADFFGTQADTHVFMPGVGINADGSAIFVATKTDPTSTFPTTILGGVLAGSGQTPFQEIESSTASYVGSRWGDFVGVAADPSGAGAVWIEHELAAADGKWRTSVIRVVSDGAAPSAPGAISQAVLPSTTLASTVSVRTSWGAATDADSGVRGYLVERSADGGGFVGFETPGLSVTQPLAIGHSYRYRVTAIDALGQAGPSTLGSLYTPTLYQSTSSTTYSGSWATSSSASFSGSSARASSTKGATATFIATGARSIAIVATRATSRGQFKVYVDNVFKATVNSYGSPTIFRRILYQFSWSTAGTHRIKVVIVGTAGHPRVDLDAFVVLR